MNKKFYGVVLMSLLLLGSFANFASSLSSWQASNPTLDSYYSGSMDTYWPILQAMEDDDCSASGNTDFIVAIPPMGCSPSVVRSDLLAEQNVPVFCQLSAIKVNPLIDVSTIKSISFKGDYPEEVAGISFHPARAAASSSNTLSGDPIEQNIGYVVIVLKKNPDEGSLEEMVSGMLTATINYDARTSFGTGAGEYYIEPLLDYEWERRANEFSFWNGKGYLRVKQIEENYAVVDVMSSKDTVIDTVTIEEGQTSDPVYYPGQYCAASVELKLNKIDVSQDSARLDIDGDNIWVRKGTKLFNGKCIVSALTIEEDNSGVVRVSCNGAEDFTLRLGVFSDDPSDTLEGQSACGNEATKEQRTFEYGCGFSRGEQLYCDYTAINSTYIKSTKDTVESIGTWFFTKEDGEWSYNYKYRTSAPEGESVFEKELVTAGTETIDANENGDKSDDDEAQGKDSYNNFIEQANAVAQIASCYDNIEVGEPELSDGKDPASVSMKYADLAEESTKELVDTYPYEDIGNGEYWGENSLREQIKLARELGDYESQLELIDLFLETYPESSSFDYMASQSIELKNYDLKGSSRSIVLNNEYHNVGLRGFNRGGGDQDTVNVRFNGGALVSLKRDKVYDNDWEEIKEDEALVYPRIKVNSIGNGGARFTYYWLDEDGDKTHETFSISNGEDYNVGDLKVLVVETQIKEVAHISLIPMIDNERTETNFTFNVGIEKRAIELNPEKANEKIKKLNDSINTWEDRLETLGNLISGMKSACLAVSGVLALKSMTDGFDGSSIARSEVMDIYEQKCREEGYSSNTELGKCYAKYSDDIETAVQDYSEAINGVNDRVDCANVEGAVDEGIFESKVVNSGAYVDELKTCAGLPDDWSVEVDDVVIVKNELTDARDYQAAILYDEACSGGDSVACEIAKSELESALSDNVQRKVLLEKTKDSLSETGVNVPNPAISNADARPQETISAKGNSIGAEDENYLTQVIDGNDRYYVELDKYGVIVALYTVSKEGKVGDRVTDLANYKPEGSGKDFTSLDDRIRSNYNFIIPSEGSSCSNDITNSNPYVRYYEAQNIQGFVGVVPFDLKNGYYAYVNQEDYTSSGEAKAFWICNAGGDKSMSDGPNGGDVCVRFSVNSGSNVIFTPCPGKSSSEVNALYTKAQNAIREANRNGNGIEVDGKFVPKASPVGTSSGGLECTDFMSVDDCNLMFNVCDPVVCPSSRCDLGGKYPVSDVVSTGIIGSLALCLPNFGAPDEGGVLIPICLSGLHAGIDSYLSLLKSHRDCLEANVETGEYSGICDEISAVYTCDLFWGQASPLIDNFLPSLLGGENQMRGGAEYLTAQSSMDNLEKSVDFFTTSYDDGVYKAFNFQNTEEIGTTFCNSFVGTSLPTFGSLLEDLTAPTSPTQFYAQFSEDAFSEATVPSTSQYKVYYHIYAGKDQGVQYKVYLRDPPQSSYYANHQTVSVEAGYISAGGSADKSKDFTAPSGYKQLCVSLNGREECGFKSVTSNFAVDYASQSYVNDQATMSGITSTDGCTSTSIGGIYPSLNLQDSVETSLGGDDIATTGITRICATSNPANGVIAGNDVPCTVGSLDVCDDGYECVALGESTGDYGVCEDGSGNKQISQGRWVDVGYCDDENIRCWLDSQSVTDSVSAYSALSGKDSVTDLMGYDPDEQYGLVQNEINALKEKIEGLGDKEDVLSGGENEASVKEIIEGLDSIIGVGNNPGEGFNIHKAQALALKGGLYRMIARALEDPDSEAVNTKRYSNDETDKIVSKDSNNDEEVEEKIEGLSLDDEGNIVNNEGITDLRISENDEGTRAAIFDSNDKIIRVIDAKDGGAIIFDDATKEEYANLLSYIEDLEENYEYDFDTGELVKKKT